MNNRLDARMGWGMAIALVLIFFGADAAYAALDNTSNNYSCSGGIANGDLYRSGSSCPTTLSADNLFSFFICNMEQLASSIMGRMFCSMITAFSPLVWAAATLAVVLFGISFTFGIVPMRGGEAVLFLLKVAFVTAFVTNADLLIGTGYRFLISGMQEGVTIALKLASGVANTANDVYGLMDGFLNTAIHFATDTISQTQAADKCKNAVFAVMVTVAAAFPIMSYLMLLLMARIALTFFRAAFGYIYALVGITFLMTLAPFFITFFLFRPTRQYFDKWLGYLASFALQIVLLFAFLAFILTLDVNRWVNDVNDIIVYNEQTVESKSFRFPWQYCTICQFKVVDKNNPTTELKSTDDNYATDGKLVCKDSPPKPLSPMNFVAADKNTNDLSSILAFLSTGLIALLVLAYIVERLLASIPNFAQRLASGLGGNYAPQMGGLAQGTGAVGFRTPIDGNIEDFNAGFRDGMKQANPLSNSVSTSAAGIREGFAAMITGRRSSGKAYTDAAGNDIATMGFANRFRGWLFDPAHYDKDY